MLLITILAIIIILLIMKYIHPKVEQPAYLVTKKISRNIEIRNYSPMIVAQVNIAGERESAIKDGFRILADYIFGNNTTNTPNTENQNQNQKIAMTAPVMQQKQNSSWLISFIIPKKYNLGTIPKPNNNKILIKQIPAKTYIAIKFSGSHSAQNILNSKNILENQIKKTAIKTLQNPTYAFYNPPWTIPFMRRNEIIWEI